MQRLSGGGRERFWSAMTLRAPLHEYALVAAVAIGCLVASRFLPGAREMPGVATGIVTLLAAYTTRPGPTALAALVTVVATLFFNPGASAASFLVRTVTCLVFSGGAVG